MVATGNVGLAFGLVAAAGLATTAGAAIVFCASLAQPKLLAGSLGFAAGVMLYVSFAEIFMRKSLAGFQATNLDSNAAYRYATLCFFGGCLLIAVLDRLVHLIAHLGATYSHRKEAAARADGMSGSASTANLLSQQERRSAGGTRRRAPAADAAPAVPSMNKAAATGAAAAPKDVESAPSAADGDGSDDASSIAASTHVPHGLSAPLTEPCDAVTTTVVAASCPDTVVRGEEDQLSAEDGSGGAAAAGGTSSRTPPAVVEIMEADHHSFMLKKMGLLTALALFIHNFPEGLATFVGALADTKIGVGLAVAIAMHNIPEGICVAMPIYYATGSRWKGFFWAFLSGVSEPVGGLIGYLALNGQNDLAFAIVFGLVAGMMVYISVKELIPTALRYDPQDSVATSCVIAGMVVMAASLLLFTL